MKKKNAVKLSSVADKPADFEYWADDAQKNRINQADLLKGLAVISVILIHTFPDALLSLIGAPLYIWQAVPVFLLLAAFTGSLAYKPRNRKKRFDFYDPSMLAKRLKRILLPFSFIWILQVVVILYLLQGDSPLHIQYTHLFLSDIPGVLVNYFSGGSGPGNYFIPVILQQILILPIFYWMAVRFSPGKMLAIAGAANIALECSVVIFGIPSGIYAISYVPYMMLGAAGVWLAFQTRKIVPWVVVAGLMSAAYVIAVYYFNFHFWFINASSGFFNIFSYFWTLLLVAGGLRFLPSQSVTRVSKTVREFGKASWHIFLVQMTFLAFFEETAIAAISTAIPGTGLWHAIICQFLLTVPSLVICLILGYGFFRTDETMRTWMREKVPAAMGQ